MENSQTRRVRKTLSTTNKFCLEHLRSRGLILDLGIVIVTAL